MSEKIYADRKYVELLANQSDWNQNDETALDFIKNRPFYMEEQPGIYILPYNIRTYETAVGAGYYCAYEKFVSSPIVGSAYTVRMNDEYYYFQQCKQFPDSSAESYIGNIGLFGEQYENTGETYAVIINVNDIGESMLISSVATDSSSSCVYGPALMPVPIDEKYLPDSVKAKSDWAENDSTSMSYVENRTHWLESGISLIEEPIVLEFSDVNENGNMHVSYKNMPSFISGETYTIMWNGTRYQAIGQSKTWFNSSYSGTDWYIGNTDLLSSSNTLENMYPDFPFVIWRSEWNTGITSGGVYLQGNEPCTVELEIYQGVHQYHTLDERFLPDSVHNDAVPQSDWNQDDTTSADYIKNKPEVTTDRISLTDRGNGYKYHIYLYNGELIIQLACTGIEVITMPTKTAYFADEEFDPTGMIVTATYADGREVVITDYVYSAPMTSGDSVVTITYTEFDIPYTTSITVDVDSATLAEKLVDFEYTVNEDGSITLDTWKGTYNGASSAQCVIPDINDSVQIIV